MKKIMFLFVLTAWTCASHAQTAYKLNEKDSTIIAKLAEAQYFIENTTFSDSVDHIVLGKGTVHNVRPLYANAIRPSINDYIIYVGTCQKNVDTVAVSRYKKVFMMQEKFLLNAEPVLIASSILGMIVTLDNFPKIDFINARHLAVQNENLFLTGVRALHPELVTKQFTTYADMIYGNSVSVEEEYSFFN